ncbi:unnamed protein product [Didymodactylos carnosus]|uniref:Single cache domain-containing protein n=2 Tax=Didymodactylos carnosus TaxID=1234261 RepID=A0A814SD35_9BILA|nr:unnamed protein product [Didymodactylos carnosus]CAF3910165.1 unnamed protein product [Didymodactylos carnosus]
MNSCPRTIFDQSLSVPSNCKYEKMHIFDNCNYDYAVKLINHITKRTYNDEQMWSKLASLLYIPEGSIKLECYDRDNNVQQCLLVDNVCHVIMNNNLTIQKQCTNHSAPLDVSYFKTEENPPVSHHPKYNTITYVCNKPLCKMHLVVVFQITNAIKKLHNYLNYFKDFAANLKKQTGEELPINYNVQMQDDLNYTRGLVAISPHIDKRVPPGTIFSTPEVLESINAEKVFEEEIQVYGPLRYGVAVPFTEANGQQVFYITAIRSSSKLATTTRFAIGQFIGYIHHFYTLLPKNKENVLTYFVKSSSTLEWVRTLTTVKDENDNYATGTTLTNAAVIKKGKRGKTFEGVVTLFGRNYSAVYKPFFLFHAKVLLFSTTLTK